MKSGKLILANFDARILEIDIKPKADRSKVTISSKMYDEKEEKNILAKIQFTDVAAIEFRINYFDNMIGAEAFGIYEITDAKFIESVIKDNFERRREVYLKEGDFEYQADDPADMLNVFDLSGTYAKGKSAYHAYIQNVDAGVYIIIAKGYAIETKTEIKFCKHEAGDKIWWVDDPGRIGVWEFSFDKKKIYNMYRDYPHNMSPEEVAIFDKENPFWADYFKDRKDDLPVND